MYCAVRNVPYRYLQVSNKHKYIAMISILQAISTIGLGIWLCNKIGTIGIAWAALISNIVFPVFFIFPVAVYKLKITFKDIFSIYVAPTFAVLIAGTIGYFIRNFMGDNMHSLFALGIVYLGMGFIYLGISWVVVLSKSERQYLASKLMSFVDRKAVA